MPQAQPLPRTAPGARSLPVRKGQQQRQLYITPAGCCTDAFLPLDHRSVKQLGWVEPPKALFFAYHPLGRIRPSYSQATWKGAAAEGLSDTHQHSAQLQGSSSPVSLSFKLIHSHCLAPGEIIYSWASPAKSEVSRVSQQHLHFIFASRGVNDGSRGQRSKPLMVLRSCGALRCGPPEMHFIFGTAGFKKAVRSRFTETVKYLLPIDIE